MTSEMDGLWYEFLLFKFDSEQTSLEERVNILKRINRCLDKTNLFIKSATSTHVELQLLYNWSEERSLLVPKKNLGIEYIEEKKYDCSK